MASARSAFEQSTISTNEAFRCVAKKLIQSFAHSVDVDSATNGALAKVANPLIALVY
jgi:hypothetical protein